MKNSIATDSEINEDDEYHNSLTIAGDFIEKPTDAKGPEGLIPEITNNVTTDYQSDKDDIWEPLSIATDSIEMQMDLRDPIDPTLGIATSATNSESQRGGEYWDPITDTYKNKRTNESVSDETKLKQGGGTTVPVSHRIGSNKCKCPR